MLKKEIVSAVKPQQNRSRPLVTAIKKRIVSTVLIEAAYKSQRIGSLKLDSEIEFQSPTYSGTATFLLYSIEVNLIED